jgi:hypothetical protein
VAGVPKKADLTPSQVTLTLGTKEPILGMNFRHRTDSPTRSHTTRTKFPMMPHMRVAMEQQNPHHPNYGYNVCIDKPSQAAVGHVWRNYALIILLITKQWSPTSPSTSLFSQ